MGVITRVSSRRVKGAGAIDLATSLLTGDHPWWTVTAKSGQDMAERTGRLQPRPGPAGTPRRPAGPQASGRTTRDTRAAACRSAGTGPYVVVRCRGVRPIPRTSCSSSATDLREPWASPPSG